MTIFSWIFYVGRVGEQGESIFRKRIKKRRETGRITGSKTSNINLLKNSFTRFTWNSFHLNLFYFALKLCNKHNGRGKIFYALLLIKQKKHFLGREYYSKQHVLWFRLINFRRKIVYIQPFHWNNQTKISAFAGFSRGVKQIIQFYLRKVYLHQKICNRFDELNVIKPWINI